MFVLQCRRVSASSIVVTKECPSLDRLEELFELDAVKDPLTQSGLIRRLKVRRYPAGSIPGYKLKSSVKEDREEWYVGVDGEVYACSRLVYKLYNKEDPGQLEVDHINRNSLDNNPHNLRLTTRSRNASNSRNSRNKTGLPGIFYDGRYDVWRPIISLDKRTYELGRYMCKFTAVDVYNRVASNKLPERILDPSLLTCDCAICQLVQ